MPEELALAQKIKLKIASVAAIADELPGILLIHNADALVEYISPRGEEQLGASLAEIKAMGHDYYRRYFNKQDADEYVPKIMELFKRNDPQGLVTYFQQVRIAPSYEWVWHMSSTKILLRDDTGKLLLFITISVPVDPNHHITSKVGRLLEENNFLRNKHASYAQLTKREREILKLTVLGKNSGEMAQELNISAATAETHRRNVRQKLDANTNYELSQYARAFDLI